MASGQKVRWITDEKEIPGATDKELRSSLLTCDGRGHSFKEKCLRELLVREKARGSSESKKEDVEVTLERMKRDLDLPGVTTSYFVLCAKQVLEKTGVYVYKALKGNIHIEPLKAALKAAYPDIAFVDQQGLNSSVHFAYLAEGLLFVKAQLEKDMDRLSEAVVRNHKALEKLHYVRAPFTNRQVQQLRDNFENPNTKVLMIHKCLNPDCPVEPALTLQPEPDGLYCPACEYKQEWAAADHFTDKSFYQQEVEESKEKEESRQLALTSSVH